MKLVIFAIGALLFCGFFQENKAQCILVGTIYDDVNDIATQSVITDTVFKTKAFSDKDGRFLISIKSESVLMISKKGFFVEYIESFPAELRDTIKKDILLTSISYFEEFDQVTVTSEKIKTVVDQFSCNVLDYIPYSEFILTLKSYKSNKYLSLEGVDTTYSQHLITNLKAKKLYEDCYGNVHLVSADSAFQVWVDTTGSLVVIERLDLETFDAFIRPCVASFANESAFQFSSNHNQKYQLILAKVEGNEKLKLYETWDKKAEKVAQFEYNGILDYYMEYCPFLLNKITHKSWDGNLNSLSMPGMEGFVMDTWISWYDNIRASKLDVFAFQTKKFISVFNLENDSLFVLSLKGKQIYKRDLKLPAKKSFRVIQDKLNSTFFALEQNKGIDAITRIDLVTGESKKVLLLDKVVSAKDIKVFDNWLYYREIKNGYHKLYRVLLDEK